LATTKQQREAAKVTRAFQAALAAMSAEAVAEALVLWADTPPVQTTATATEWTAKAIVQILRGRRRTRELGLAYYRLHRAILTGKTIADTRRTEAKFVSIKQLEREFNAVIRGEPIPDEPSSPATEIVQVERLFDIKKVLDQLDQYTEDAATTSLEEVGPKALERANDKLDTSKPATEVDAAREEAHKKAGTSQAGVAQKHVANGARGVVYGLSKLDKEVIGWVRVSTTGTPCGFCAMLISRGPITKKDGDLGGIYLSKASAGDTGDPADKFHPNCNCVAEPLYSLEQFNNDPLYALNRLYAEQWPEVTKGLSGLDALNAWRTFIRRQADIEIRPAAQAA
jgi:hypothetical protein